MATTLDLQTIRYEVIEGSIARIALNRPEARNAQNRRMTSCQGRCRDHGV